MKLTVSKHMNAASDVNRYALRIACESFIKPDRETRRCGPPPVNPDAAEIQEKISKSFLRSRSLHTRILQNINKQSSYSRKEVEMKELLQVNDLCKKNILRNINFSVGEGEMVAIMGPSDSGKSTLLYNVSGMDQPDSGEVWLDGTETVRLSEDDKARLRLNKMGFVFQQMNMLANLNILDNILLPSVHADKSRAFQTKQKEKALQLMAQFGISALTDRRINEVSGGQLQRACICRSMMLSPRILFADEPTGALNQTASGEVLRAFQRINDAGTTILMVTHDSRVAAKCRRILYILDGEIRGELLLEAYSEDEDTSRQQKTTDWLKMMGW